MNKLLYCVKKERKHAARFAWLAPLFLAVVIAACSSKVLKSDDEADPENTEEIIRSLQSLENQLKLGNPDKEIQYSTIRSLRRSLRQFEQSHAANSLRITWNKDADLDADWCAAHCTDIRPGSTCVYFAAPTDLTMINPKEKSPRFIFQRLSNFYELVSQTQ